MPAQPSSDGASWARFEVVFVCTGNMARSPFAAGVLRDRVEHLPVSVRSVGVSDTGASPALTNAISAARDRGVDLRAHRSHALTAGALRNVDLILGFEREHVAAAVVVGDAEPERTFLLGELARLVVLDEVVEHVAVTPSLFIARSASRRDEVALPHEVVTDPIGRSLETFCSTFAHIEHLIDIIAPHLFFRTAWPRA